MSDVITPVAEEPVELAPGVSIDAHRNQFGPEALEQAAEDAVAEPVTEPSVPRPEQRRDQQNGRYANGFKRHRAQSQQATPEDVKQIDALTKRLKTAEEQYGKDIPKQDGESERAYTIRRRAELIERIGKPAVQTPVQPMPAQPVAQPAAPVGFSDAEPTLQEFIGKSDDPYLAHARALASFDRRRDQAIAQQQMLQQQRFGTFRQRTDAAKAKYADFEQVAYKPFHPAMDPYVQPGTPVGDFILDDDNGPDVLYHLQQHPEELDAILRCAPLQQVKQLTLLTQRFASSSPQAAGSNGAAPSVTPVVLPPKPPTPLRTEAQRSGSTPPPTDGSIRSIDEHRRAFAPKAR